MPGKKTLRLKVFATRIGIRDWVVAAPSQKAALAAWDVRDNLFASGAAWVVDDPEAVAAAMKTPGVPTPAPGQKSVRVSSAEVISLEARRPKKEPAKPAPKRDRSKLNAAEAALAKHESEAKKERAAMEKRRRLIEDEAENLGTQQDRQRRALEARLEKARRDYENT